MSARATRIVPTLGGIPHYRQVQYWDARRCVWVDYGQALPKLAHDTLMRKLERCAAGWPA